MEQWRNISGFEGFYQVSNYGRVRSLNRLSKNRYGGLFLRKGRMLKPVHDSYGYCIVSLVIDNSRISKKIHRLVAEAFYPDAKDKRHVNHKDGNKQNNIVENLEYCSPLHNYHHGRIYGNIKSIKGENPNAKVVIDLQTGVYYDCAKDVCDLYGFKYSTFKSKLNGNHRIQSQRFKYAV